ncbi:MAG: class I SAM-dependent methyltransferase [Myxococcales bacterium]|nr:class I SAM-dependent methyltransferase [Myxococcota bacterium]MDW8282484.1 class I SAM-dependent methyltransferase [Myxococcales bacterium]
MVDWYDGDVLWAEYMRRHPRSDQEQREFVADVEHVLCTELQVQPDHLHVRRRERQRGTAQYSRLGSARRERIIAEGGHRFLVNLSDYLDTGLFLDHRDTRALVGRMAAGRRVLNLFGYTGSFTVYAARGGAVASVTVDLSRTYLAWAATNLALNGVDRHQHRLVRADALRYLEENANLPSRFRPQFDLIILDPPTFSNSKRMSGTLDVQRDHPRLLRQALRLLAPGGDLIFSSHCRTLRVRMDEVPEASWCDITEQTLPRDFHQRRTHHCFLLRHAPGATGSPRLG